jgi:SAM-dependent methyltransferase
MPDPEPGWFNPLAAFLGEAYLRNAFTLGTVQEVAFLIAQLRLRPGMRVLDVGCGPGRHALELARSGIEVHGVDLSPDFIRLAREAAEAEGLPVTLEVADVCALDADGAYDAAICLCQGGFGLLGGDDDPAVVGRIARAVRPGGAVAVTAFHSYFALRWQEEGEGFDPRTGVVHEVATLRNAEGGERPFDLWTTCFTTRELTLLAEGSGLGEVRVSGVRPGEYGTAAPTLDHPELLLLARRLGSL